MINFPLTDSSGFLLIDLAGTQLTAEDRQLLARNEVAGVLLFTRNYQDRQQLTELTRDIRNIRSDLLITVDQEGGLVQRFKKGFTRLPAAAYYARYALDDPERALSLVRDSGWLMASELLACGVDLSLAPVLDLDLGLNSVIGSRAFGKDTETVSRLSGQWCEGVREAGMACVGKHFPGHGSVTLDSHLALPVDTRPYPEILGRDMQPFLSALENNMEAIMPAHIVFSQVDDKPAGFSEVWLKDILRQRLGFNGIVISDCLTMAGAASAGSYSQRVEQALNAGCDLLLLSSREGLKEVLADAISRPSGQNQKSVQQLRARSTMTVDQLQSLKRYMDCQDRLDHLMEHYVN